MGNFEHEARRQAKIRECELRARDEALAEQAAQLRARDKEVEQLYQQFSELYRLTQNLLASLRWRIGNAIGSVLAKLTGRGGGTPAAAYIEAVHKRVEKSATVARLKQQAMPRPELAPIPRAYDAQAVAFALERLKGEKRITVIIPIYNAPEATRRCIDSVLAHSTIPHDLLLINDASPDPAIKVLLAHYAHHAHVRVRHHDANLGFVGTVNAGMAEAKGDVVLLNSDTEVTARWLQKLVAAAASAPDIATVTPLSNAAGAFSVPESGINDVPEALGLAGMARRVEHASKRVYPRVPTGNGFCLYIRREALDEVGLFDAESFGRGYGEENDFCMRAAAKGWQHVIDDATYIYHQRSASFGPDKEALIKKNREILDQRYADYGAKVKAFLADSAMAAIRQRIREAIEQPGAADSKQTILYVLHQGGGGTPYTNMDLMLQVVDTHRCFLLTSNALALTLWEVQPERRLVKCRVWPLAERWRVDAFYRPENRQLYFALLAGLGVDIVHIRHLIGHTFDLPQLAHALGLKVVLSFHDFYFSCPSIHLIDSRGRYCGGDCHVQKRQCQHPSWLQEPPHLSSWNAAWRREVARMFACCDQFITTTEAAKAVYLASFPEALADRPFAVIEHGRDFPPLALHQPPQKGGVVHILLPGQLGLNKGMHFVRALKERDRAQRLHFHLLGKDGEQWDELGTVHGEYERDQLFDKVRAIRPAFVGIFSIWAETYCHTLSEAWACGIPVLASDIGAIKERVEKTGAGWLLDIHDPEAAYRRILAVADDADEYARVAAKAAAVRMPTTEEMARDYLRIYQGAKAA